jgi:hypothetical protein
MSEALGSILLIANIIKEIVLYFVSRLLVVGIHLLTILHIFHRWWKGNSLS